MSSIRYPKVKATKNNTFELVEDFTIMGVTIPKGFTSDGLTLKVKLLRLIVNKYEPKFQPFYFLHDYLCREEKYKLADELSSKVLFKIKDSYMTRFGMRLIDKYHRIRYRSHYE